MRAKREVVYCFPLSLFLQFSYNLWLMMLRVCSIVSEIEMWGSYFGLNWTGHKTSLQNQATVRIHFSWCSQVQTVGLKEINELRTFFFFFSSWGNKLSVLNNDFLLWEVLEVKGFQPSDQDRSSGWIACVTCSKQQITASIREENTYLTTLY